MVRPYLLLLITALLGCRSLVGQTSSPKSAVNRNQSWSEFVSEKDGFAMMLPEAPSPHKDTQLADGTAYTVHLRGNVTLTLHVGIFPEGCGDVFNKHLAAVKEDIPQAKQSKPTKTDQFRRLDISSVREFKAAGYPAVEYEQEVTDSQGKVRFYQRLECVDKRLYIFGAAWPAGSPKSADVTRAVDSFRLVRQ